jgi:hypothetical protein
MSEFPGLTLRDCVEGCNEKACVISGKPYCAHPAKGVPHGADAKDPEIAARYTRARNLLGLKPPLGQEATTS